jgi:hypothetical protein
MQQPLFYQSQNVLLEIIRSAREQGTSKAETVYTIAKAAEDIYNKLELAEKIKSEQ